MRHSDGRGHKYMHNRTCIEGTIVENRKDYASRFESMNWIYLYTARKHWRSDDCWHHDLQAKRSGRFARHCSLMLF